MVGFGAAILGNLARFTVDSLITFVILFFLFREGKDWAYRAGKLAPLSDVQVARLYQNISDTIIANVYGILTVGVAQGILTGIAMRIVGMPSALLLGLGAGFASIIPVVGSCAGVGNGGDLPVCAGRDLERGFPAGVGSGGGQLHRQHHSSLGGRQIAWNCTPWCWCSSSSAASRHSGLSACFWARWWLRCWLRCLRCCGKRWSKRGQPWRLPILRRRFGRLSPSSTAYTNLPACAPRYPSAP